MPSLRPVGILQGLLKEVSGWFWVVLVVFGGTGGSGMGGNQPLPQSLH